MFSSFEQILKCLFAQLMPAKLLFGLANIQLSVIFITKIFSAIGITDPGNEPAYSSISLLVTALVLVTFLYAKSLIGK